VPAAAPPWAPYERVWLALAEGAIGQTGFQGDNYYRPVTFSAPSLGNVPCQTTGASFRSGALKGLLMGGAGVPLGR